MVLDCYLTGGIPRCNSDSSKRLGYEGKERRFDKLTRTLSSNSGCSNVKKETGEGRKKYRRA